MGLEKEESAKAADQNRLMGKWYLIRGETHD
jgi:hypothetical protein